MYRKNLLYQAMDGYDYTNNTMTFVWIVVAIIVFAVIGFLIWYFLIRKKDDKKDPGGGGGDGGKGDGGTGGGGSGGTFAVSNGNTSGAAGNSNNSNNNGNNNNYSRTSPFKPLLEDVERLKAEELKSTGSNNNVITGYNGQQKHTLMRTTEEYTGDNEQTDRMNDDRSTRVKSPVGQLAKILSPPSKRRKRTDKLNKIDDENE